MTAASRTLVIPLGALLTAVLVSLYFKPIFKQPVFAANLLPFLVLGAAAGRGASPAGPRARRRVPGGPRGGARSRSCRCSRKGRRTPRPRVR